MPLRGYFIRRFAKAGFWFLGFLPKGSACAVGSIAARAAKIVSGVLRPPSDSLAGVQEAD